MASLKELCSLKITNLGDSFFKQKGWQKFIKKSWTHGKIRGLFSKKMATFG